MMGVEGVQKRATKLLKNNAAFAHCIITFIAFNNVFTNLCSREDSKCLLLVRLQACIRLHQLD